jgi:hypothetical protein
MRTKGRIFPIKVTKKNETVVTILRLLKTWLKSKLGAIFKKFGTKKKTADKIRAIDIIRIT